MKVIGISSSPRRGGNSEKLLDRALEGSAAAGAAVDKIILNDIVFKPCQECGGCDKSGTCVIRDGMDDVYRKLSDADAVIFSSPIFFSSLSAQAKMMIDRFQCAWIAKYVLNRPHGTKKRKGIFLSVAGSYRKDQFENARQIVKALFATIDVEYVSDILCGGIEKVSDLDKEGSSLERAYTMGKDLVISNV